MQDFIAQFGDYAPLIFLLLASILPIFLFPPGIFSIIGGYLFGFKLGAILTITAAIVYTNIMFLISRYFARDYIEKFLVRKLSLKEFNRIFGIFQTIHKTWSKDRHPGKSCRKILFEMGVILVGANAV